MGTFFYNWRKIEGYNAPINVVISQRGLGKTFGVVKKVLKDFVKSKDKFVYVVETQEDVKTLSSDKGARFFAGIKSFLANETSNNSKKLYSALFENNAEIEEGETDLLDKNNEQVIGGTIKIGKETAGYLISLNNYGNLKRNNFDGVKTIIIDEFISEEIDIRHLKIGRKVVSVVQSVARRRNVKIYMLGNAIRLNDVLLVKMKINNMRMGEIRKIKDKKGVLIVAHYVNPNEYEEFSKASEDSVAGRLATLMGEDNLDKNTFNDRLSQNLEIVDAKQSKLFFCLHGENNTSLRFNLTSGGEEIYVLTDYGKNTNKRFCLDKKFIKENVYYNKDLKDMILNYYNQGRLKFESSYTFAIFKNIINIAWQNFHYLIKLKA